MSSGFCDLYATPHRSLSHAYASVGMNIQPFSGPQSYRDREGTKRNQTRGSREVRTHKRHTRRNDTRIMRENIIFILSLVHGRTLAGRLHLRHTRITLNPQVFPRISHTHTRAHKLHTRRAVRDPHHHRPDHTRSARKCVHASLDHGRMTYSYCHCCTSGPSFCASSCVVCLCSPVAFVL